MHVVAAVSQFEAKLRRYDAAAAVGGITGDSDLHGVLVQISVYRPYWRIRGLDGPFARRIQPLVTAKSARRSGRRLTESTHLTKVEGALE
jgi:hypothetical protein